MPRAGGPAGAGGDAGPVERDRWTGARDAAGAAADGAIPARADGDAAGAEAGAAADDAGVPGIARSGATGMRCTAGAPAGDAGGSPRVRGPDSAPGRAGSANAPESRPWPAAGSRTAGDGAPLNDGFCQVGSRPPNPASATPGRRPPVDRWIGGRAVHAATATGGAGTPAVAGTSAGLAVLGVPAVLGASPCGAGLSESAPPVPPCRPRSRSRNPTAQPSAAPRVTRDAICSVYRRRSWCSRSRIASRPQWKW
ncbi:hypothetical protein SHO565_40740 [Streptomyces sp. HO565]